MPHILLCPRFTNVWQSVFQPQGWNNKMFFFFHSRPIKSFCLCSEWELNMSQVQEVWWIFFFLLCGSCSSLSWPIRQKVKQVVLYINFQPTQGFCFSLESTHWNQLLCKSDWGALEYLCDKAHVGWNSLCAKDLICREFCFWEAVGCFGSVY